MKKIFSVFILLFCGLFTYSQVNSLQLQGIIDFEMEIFNRWGQMVFKSSNINQKWDGTFRGKDLPTGTYIYKIKIITYGENQKSVKSGTISLVR